MAIPKLLNTNTTNLMYEIENFFNDKGRGSSNTSKTYKQHVQEFLTFFNLDKEYVELEDLTNIKHRDILTFVNYLEQSGNKSSTIKAKLAGLKSLWKFLAKDYGTNFNPYIWDVTLVKEEETNHPEFTSEEFELFLEFAKSQQQKGLEKYLYFKTLYVTGLRKQAVLDMIKSNINKVTDISGDDLWVIKVRDKGGKYDSIPISDEFYSELSQLLNGKLQADKIFNINDKTLYKVISDFRKKYNIDKKLTIHSIKSTSVTETWNRTGDIKLTQEQGHHADATITLRKYVRSDRNLKNKMSYKMDKKVDTKSLEDLTKEQLINIINNCSDATKTEILKYV